jgi:hypothetical protein
MHLKNKSQYFAALTFDKYVNLRALRYSFISFSTLTPLSVVIFTK